MAYEITLRFAKMHQEARREWTRMVLETAWTVTGSVVVKWICKAWGPEGNDAHRGRMFPVSLLPDDVMRRIDTSRVALFTMQGLGDALSFGRSPRPAVRAAQLQENDGYEYVAIPYTPPAGTRARGDGDTSEGSSDNGSMPDLETVRSFDEDEAYVLAGTIVTTTDGYYYWM